TDLATLSTHQSLGALPFTLAAGDFSAGGRVALTNGLASRTNATAVTPLQTIPGGVVVSQVFVGEDGVVDLALRVVSNRTYVVQASTNFVNWVNVFTNFADTDLLIASDSTAVGMPFRFYRGVSISVGGQPLAQSQANNLPARLAGAKLQSGARFIFEYATT